MADLSKLKRRNTLGSPPPLEEASQNLQAPEIAPAIDAPAALPRRAAALRQRSTTQQATPRQQNKRRLDGRSMRKTGRTVNLPRASVKHGMTIASYRAARRPVIGGGVGAGA